MKALAVVAAASLASSGLSAVAYTILWRIGVEPFLGVGLSVAQAWAISALVVFLLLSSNRVDMERTLDEHLGLLVGRQVALWLAVVGALALQAAA